MAADSSRSREQCESVGKKWETKRRQVWKGQKLQEKEVGLKQGEGTTTQMDQERTQEKEDHSHGGVEVQKDQGHEVQQEQRIHERQER